MTTRPRGVRVKKPSCIRYGSYTSSMVEASSPVMALSVSSPTGPPPNLSIIVVSIARSSFSRPSSSTSSMSMPCRATSSVITPPARICAKSRTRLSMRLAMRGVPRLRRAISSTPSSSVRTLRIPALRRTMAESSCGEYSSRRKRMPNRSRSGALRSPARVVAPTSVKRGRSRRMLRAVGPLPIMISSA